MKKMLATLAIAGFLFAMPGCKSKVDDATVKTAVETALTTNPDYSGVTVDIKDGVATISGSVKDDATKAAVETAVKGVKDVKSVANNVTVTPPPPPVEITADDPLTKGVTDALKDHPTVKATIADGVITVTGTATKDEWKKVKMSLDGLGPKKVDAAALVIK